MSLPDWRKVLAAGVLVVAGFGGAAFLVGSESSAAPADDLQQAWTLVQQSSVHKKWKQQNPGESAKLETYWASGGTAPALATLYGRAWVLVKTGQIGASTPPPTTTQPPPTTTQPPPTTTEPPPTTTQPPPPTAGNANLWVDANGGSCARSATAGPYNDATACSSFASAYTAAASNDTVGVTGSIGVQFFAGDSRGTQPPGSKTLLFRGATGNKVRQISFGSPNLTFDAINVDGGGVRPSIDAALFENGGAPFTFKNGSIGNVRDQKGALVTEAGIVFDNVDFHDVDLVTDGVHLECIWAGVPQGMIIRNSRFTRCDVMDLFFVYPDYWNPLPPPYGNVTLENNQFGAPSPGYSVYIGKNGVSLSNQTPMSGWRVRNNFFDPASYGVNNDQPVGSNNVFCGNTGHAGLPSGWKNPC